ncbi:MAG: FKBP-type peptidyl-prolyl cis-trans isomerase [Deltaproteobacteria bacterium]|nr:FKBP-type peptidyl-prolyl cis-trans isomerase [Deltaproteobacteria bacterium]
MKQAKKGNRVKVRYTGKFRNGRLFDVSCSRVGLEFEIGEGKVLRPFEKGVLGMRPGGRKRIVVPPEEGSKGANRSNRVSRRSSPGVKTKRAGSLFVSSVIDVNKQTGAFDPDHPLAGKTLIYDVELVKMA